MQNDPAPKPVTIWAVSDGRAGNAAQALGLAEAIARRRAAEIADKRITLHGWAALVPPALAHLLGARAGGWPFSGIAEGRDGLAPPWPDLAIGAGRRVAPIVAALGRLHGVRTVQMLAPQMPASAFDLVVVPEHDRLRGGNVLTTLGAVGRMTAERIAAEATRWHDRLAHLPRPRIALLLGGPSKSALWREQDGRRLVAQMAALSTSGHGLMITPSRRSDPAVVETLRAACDPDATFLWDGAGDNPYPGILGLADAVMVTEDSVNMTSEAAATGLPVHVFRVSGRSKKIAAFHDAMAARGITRPFAGRIEDWSYTPLQEADRVAGEVLDRLLSR